VFEKFGIHHDEREVPTKVKKSLEDKARKNVIENTTVAVEAKKRKGAGGVKTTSKKQKIGAASAATSVGTG